MSFSKYNEWHAHQGTWHSRQADINKDTHSADGRRPTALHQTQSERQARSVLAVQVKG